MILKFGGNIEQEERRTKGRRTKEDKECQERAKVNRAADSRGRTVRGWVGQGERNCVSAAERAEGRWRRTVVVQNCHNALRTRGVTLWAELESTDPQSCI